MTILTVRKTTITLGFVIDAYTADEKDSQGRWINYLSGTGLSKSIGFSATTTLPNRLPKELEAKLGEGFTTLLGKYKMSSGGLSSLNLWKTQDAAKYWLHHFRQGNELAETILDALTGTTLDIIINDLFQREYAQGSAQLWTENRILTKESFWFMGDAVKQYYLDNPRVERYQGQNYSEVFDLLNLGLFGKKSKEIKEDLGIGKNALNRDHFGKQSLKRIEMVQRLAEAQMSYHDNNPLNAVEYALIQMGYNLGFIDFRE